MHESVFLSVFLSFMLLNVYRSHIRLIRDSDFCNARHNNGVNSRDLTFCVHFAASVSRSFRFTEAVTEFLVSTIKDHFLIIDMPCD